MLNYYLSVNNTSIFQRYITTIIFLKIVNELHAWIENRPSVIHLTNFSDFLFVKINDTFVRKHKNLLQISVLELHNDMILPIYQGGYFGARTVDLKVCIVDTSLKNYIPKYI